MANSCYGALGKPQLDTVNKTLRCWGWAVELNAQGVVQSNKVGVGIFRGNSPSPIATGTANLEYPAAKQWGYGDGYNGFDFTIDISDWDYGSYTIKARGYTQDGTSSILPGETKINYYNEEAWDVVFGGDVNGDGVLDWDDVAFIYAAKRGGLSLQGDELKAGTFISHGTRPTDADYGGVFKILGGYSLKGTKI